MSACFICGKPLNEGNIVEVKERGVQTLLAASIKRGEKEHELLLKDLDHVSAHAACQKNYADERKAAAASRRKCISQSLSSEPPSQPSSQSPSQPPSPPPETLMFDFATKCFICTETIAENYQAQQKKYSSKRRPRIHMVPKFSNIKNTVLKILQNRDDEYARQIVKRILNVPDIAAVGAKYHQLCILKLRTQLPTGTKRGGTNECTEAAMESIFSYISENYEDCQFQLSQLVNQVEGDYRPDLRTVRYYLQQKYGEDICIFDYKGHDAFVCFRSTGYKTLSAKWYDERNSNKKKERLRVVREAAAIILEDIRSQFYDTETYSPSDDFMKDVNSVVPESLHFFFSELIMKSKRGSAEKWERKCTALSHAVISAVRPRSFFSPLQMGVGSFLYKKFGSRNLIDVLAALGFSSSYREVSIFEASCIKRQQPHISQDAFSQFVFDNADFNVNTLNGDGTFHAMGGIHCVTPFDAIDRDQAIPRNPKKDTALVIGNFGTVPLISYGRPKLSGLQTLVVADIESIRPIGHNILPTTCDLMWLYAKWSSIPNIPGWNGFMEEATIAKSFEKSKIFCLPFINAPPTDYATIYTALLSAVEKCKIVNQNACIVTFDLPLYMKAHDIISNADPTSAVKNIIVRLGGFHLLMSFLGAIGFIMSGSGLEDLLKVIYAANSVEKIISGHAYSRAVRAHTLTHLALAKKIIDSIEFTQCERDEMNVILCNAKRSAILTAAENLAIHDASNKFDKELQKTENRGPTAKLWLQYFRMVTLVKQFIEAERSGNWGLHLDTIQKMLPYFHASGHFLYAKAAHLYLQDMAALHEKMLHEEYEKFTADGNFTIRRTNKFWSGIMTDMTIEQTLMRSMKTSGGLTQGRGMTDSVLTRWTLGMVFLQNVCEEVENFCGISSATTEQHVDMRSSRVTRDNADIAKLDNLFVEHPPFPKSMDLRSISTGVVGNSTINCHLSGDIGAEMVSRMVGVSFNTLKFKRKDRVLPLAVVSSSIKIGDAPVPIDPLLLFQRMCIAKETEEDLKDHLTYELAPYPLSIFTDEGMRKGTKSTLYNCFSPLPDDTDLKGNRMEVVDGGFLLHRLVWDRNTTFVKICQKYVKYIQDNFGPNTTVVFDIEGLGTKASERLRRSRKHCSAKVVFDESMIPSMPQEKFLANESNKSRFIKMLKKEFQQSGFFVKQAEEDADTLIVNTAIQLSSRYDAVIIVGEDIDLLVLLTGLANQHTNIFFRKPGKGRTSEKIYSPRCLKYGKAVVDNILFLHAFSGCDTTSAVYNAGKAKFLKTLEKNQELLKPVELFKQKKVDHDMIAQAGERFFVALYGGSSEASINSVRFKCFGNSATKSKVNLSALPPTKAAVRQHSLRTYHQVQTWLGVQQDPVEWGWKRTTRGLEPVTNTMAPAPKALLELISCKCKAKCRAACGCRKAGLKCSIICLHCSGQTCENVPQVTVLEEKEMDDEVPAEINGTPTSAELLESDKIIIENIEVRPPKKSSYKNTPGNRELDLNRVGTT